MELHQVNRKQDMIIKRIQKVENQVVNHDKEIQHLQKLQDQMGEKLNHIDEIVDIRFNPDVTLVAINLPNYPSENDLWLTKRLLSAMGCGDKCTVGAMRMPQYQNRKGVFKIELCSKQDKIDVLHCKASLKHSREFRECI